VQSRTAVWLVRAVPEVDFGVDLPAVGCGDELLDAVVEAEGGGELLGREVMSSWRPWTKENFGAFCLETSPRRRRSRAPRNLAFDERPVALFEGVEFGEGLADGEAGGSPA
jgi:hypothetical protein